MNDGLMKRRLRSAPFSDWTANSAMEQHEVEEVSFLPGEAILNKKAVYEPSKSQRFRQIVCSRGVAISILMGMGATMVGIALIAAFARPASMSGACNNVSSSSNGISLAASGSSSSSSSSGKINNNNNDNNSGGTGNDGKNQISKPDYIATNGEKFPWKDLRLPTSIEPVNYDIFLHPNISQSYFKGRVLMTLKVLQKTDFIVFHTHELNLSDVAVKYYSGNSDDGDSSGSAGKSCRELQSHGEGVEDKRASGYTPGASVRVKKQLEYKAFQQYYVQTEVDLQPGTNIELTVGFRGSLADLAKMVGLYQSAYTVNGELRHMISTHFEASDARSAFPCMDEPELKATFSLKIVRDRAMITLFNTALLRQEPYRDDDDVSGSDNKGDSLVLDVYERTVCMSTYLVAYVVTDFKNLTKYTKDGVMVRVWAPEDKIYMGQFALDAAVTIIEKYNKFFGIAYPLKKQDLIAIPNFAAGAMENWGLITYRDTAVLYDPDKSTVYTKKIVALVVAHELAHQWFGNLVTMKWWNDLWLNEGFAAYVENIGAQTVDPSFRMFESMVSESKASLSLDSLSSSHAIEVEVKDPAEVQSAFNSITYKKGARLIHMLKGAIGGEKFHQGLNYYLRVHAYGNAETEQLWEAFEKYSNLDNLRVSEFMDTWTKQMGFPVVTVTRVNSLIEISQERFLRNNDSDTSPYSWHIPFKYKLSTNPSKTKMVWMKKGDASIHLPPSSTVAWIKGNADSEGYYRVNYDSRGWKAIGQQLMEDHEVFSVLDRVGLLDDAFKLAQSGRLKYSVVLDLCRYMVKEKDYFVWDTFIGNVMYLEERLYLHEAYDSLKTYILHLSKPLIDSIGWQETGPITERLLRTLMFSLAISSQYETVVNKSNGWFREWLADDSFKMNNDLRNMVFQCGVKYGTKADWDVVYDRFQASVVPSNKGGLMSALARSRDARTLQILLERSLDTSQIKSQSTASVVAGVAANPNGLLFAWRFVRQNWSTFFGRYGSGAFTLAGLINNVMGHFSTQFDLDEVSSFFQDKDLGSAKNSYHQTLDIIKGNIAWNKLHLEPVYVWLKDFVKANNLSNGST